MGQKGNMTLQEQVLEVTASTAFCNSTAQMISFIELNITG